MSRYEEQPIDCIAGTKLRIYNIFALTTFPACSFMTILKYTTLAALIVFTISALSLYIAWSDTVGADRMLSAWTSAVSATSIGLIAGGLILAGDAAFLRYKIQTMLHQAFVTPTGLRLVLVILVVGIFTAAIAWTSFRVVNFSSNKNLILINDNEPGKPYNIGEISESQEQKVLLRAGTHFLGYRIVGTECTGSLSIINVPSWFDGAVPRIPINVNRTDCEYETLQNPDQVHHSSSSR